LKIPTEKAKMNLTVIVSTNNQKERLRLVLAGLENQTLPADQFELIVVDDGSTDGTRELLEHSQFPNLVVHLKTNKGRCLARNEGITRAQGELVVFLDGDALPHPGLLEAYWIAYCEAGAGYYFLGHSLVLPELEFFQDPQAGTLVDGRLMTRTLATYLRTHRQEWTVTGEMIRANFAAIETQAVEGGYPTRGGAQMQRNLIQLLSENDKTRVSWVGFVPHNAAVPLIHLKAEGGFDSHIPFSEGMELAYRLHQRGLYMRYVPQAKSYHLYHHHDFSDQRQSLIRYQAISYMAHKHAENRILLVRLLHSYFWPAPFIPSEAVIKGFSAFEELYYSIGPAQLCRYVRMLEFLSPDAGISHKIVRQGIGANGVAKGRLRRLAGVR
jgi:glycosyltransferase involved in cell wall biosynthesis